MTVLTGPALRDIEELLTINDQDGALSEANGSKIQAY